MTLQIRDALAEITADPNQQVLVGEVGGRVVCTAQVSWLRVLTADGGLYCQVEAVRTRAHTFYERLGFQVSHVGMKKYL